MKSLSERFIEESNFEPELAMSKPSHTYMLARWFYKIGQPIVPDKFYDKLHQVFMDAGLLNHLTSSHYEDDEFPINSFKEFGVSYEPYKLEEDRLKELAKTDRINKWESELNDEESKSIFPIESLSSAWTWFRDFKGKEVLVSLKVDGINTKNLYALNKENEFKHQVSATRSRSGSGIDITDNMERILPQTLTVVESTQTIFVRGEVYVPSKALPYLREKYQQPYKIPRSTALSAIRVGFNDEDMHLLKLKVFKMGLGETVSEGYSIAESLGFETPPYEVITIPEDLTYENTEEWLTPILEKYKRLAMEEDIPSDGLVVQLNDLNHFNTIGSFGNYNHGAVALKLGPWQAGVYEGVVKDIQIETKMENGSYVAIIEPVVVSSGVEVKRVNIFNADIMIKNNINIGSIIPFEYKSESSVNLIYKKGE